MDAEAIRAWLVAQLDEDERVAQTPSGNGYEPDRVVRGVAAKRRRLARHAPLHPTLPFSVCAGCSSALGAVPWPCPDIVDDAQSYTGRLDFPNKLRVTT